MRHQRRISTGAFLLITIGVIFLLGNMGIVDNAFARLWPLLIIVIGLVKVAEAFMK